ncbi:MAG: KdsC family phosphatase [Flavobacteriia bacterium]
MDTRSYKEILPQITTFIFDVDGVLTNGDVLLMNGSVYRTLNSKDGYALQYATKLGYSVFIITGGNSEDVKNRLINLGVKEVCLKSSNKIQVYKELKERYNFSDEEVLYMGDDIPDYEVMLKVALSTCPQDSAQEIKAISRYQSPISGGKGCVRDVIEQTLKVQGKWMQDLAFEW